MARQATINVFRFEELTGCAKERAREWLTADGYNSAAEALATLKALARAFGGKLGYYSIDWEDTHTYSAARLAMPEFETPDDECHAIAETLATLGEVDPLTGKGMGECKLTGYCFDEDALDGVREAYRNGERDLPTLMEAGFRALLKATASDAEWQRTDEVLTELCDANDYEFADNGSPFQGDAKRA